MNVAQLKLMVAEIPEELNSAKVIMASDGEGNNFSDLDGVSIDKGIQTDEYWCGILPLHPNDLDEYEEDELVDVVTIW